MTTDELSCPCQSQRRDNDDNVEDSDEEGLEEEFMEMVRFGGGKKTGEEERDIRMGLAVDKGKNSTL